MKNVSLFPPKMRYYCYILLLVLPVAIKGQLTQKQHTIDALPAQLLGEDTHAKPSDLIFTYTDISPDKKYCLGIAALNFHQCINRMLWPAHECLNDFTNAEWGEAMQKMSFQTR